MLNITTPYSVQNVTRMRCMSANIGVETVMVNSVLTEVPIVNCVVQFRPNAGEHTEAEQRAMAYGPDQTIRVRNGVCDTVLFTTDANANQYTGAIVRGTTNVADGYDQIVSQIQTGTAAGIFNRVEARLALIGCVPAGS